MAEETPFLPHSHGCLHRLTGGTCNCGITERHAAQQEAYRGLADWSRGLTQEARHPYARHLDDDE